MGPRPARGAAMSAEKADGDHRRTLEVADSLDGRTVEAAGTVSEGMEYVERARGHLYAFHQLMGRADKLLAQAAEELGAAGQVGFAAELSRDIVGRDVLPGRWTYQIVEEFDSGYWDVLRSFVQRFSDDALDGQRHVAEALMRRNRRTR